MSIKRIFPLILMSLVLGSSMAQAHTGRSCQAQTEAKKSESAPKKQAPTCEIDTNVQDDILRDLYNEVFVLLKGAETSIRNLANCFEQVPKMRSGETEPRYSTQMTCAEIRSNVVRDITNNWRKMRINLALAEPARRTYPTEVETMTSPASVQYRINPNAQHRFKNLATLPPLSTTKVAGKSELDMVMDVWNKNTENFNQAYGEVSCLERDLDRYNSRDPRMMQFLVAEDEKSRIAFLAKKREESRSLHLKAYTEALADMPLIAFMPRGLETGVLTDNDRELIRTSIYTLLYNNCVVRQTKFSTTGEWRSTYENKCRIFIDNMKEDAKTLSLEQQDARYAEFHGHLDSQKPLENLDYPLIGRGIYMRSETLNAFGLYEKFLEAYKSRITDKARLCQFEALKNEYDNASMIMAGAEMGVYAGLGLSCSFIVGKIAGPIGRFGTPLCFFATGLPLSYYQWTQGGDDYTARYNEVFASAPYRELLQELKSLNDAQTAQLLNTVFLGIGTGVPELYKGSKLWYRFLRMKQRSSS